MSEHIAGKASRFWGHRVNSGMFDFRIFSRKPVLEAGAGYERLMPSSLTVGKDPRTKPDVLCDLFRLPFADRSFGLVIAHEVFCTYSEEEQARLLLELWRVGDSLYLRQWGGCGWCVFGNPRCGFKFPNRGKDD
ncbi:MAG: class I SAM-dependent methyltransferase [Thermoplasmata archaeon]